MQFFKIEKNYEKNETWFYNRVFLIDMLTRSFGTHIPSSEIVVTTFQGSWPGLLEVR